MKFIACIIFHFALIGGIVAQTKGQVEAPDAYGMIRRAVDDFRGMESLRSASWGFCVTRVMDNMPVVTYNADMTLIPASTAKIATTYAAWKVLGPEYRFITRLETDAKADSAGVLNGSLYIRGGGDPSFCSDRFPGMSEDSCFSRFLNALVSMGIKEINGSVIGAADVMEDDLVEGSWSWDDIGNYYGAGACGLNFNENAYQLRFNPGKEPGMPARVISVEPPLAGIDFENQVTTGKKGSGDQVVIYGAPYSGLRVLKGSVPANEAGFSVKGSLPDPPLQAARRFKDYLTHHDIVVAHEATTTRILENSGNHVSRGLVCIDSVESPPLGEIVAQTHLKSINTYADALLLTLGRVNEQIGSYSSGIRFLKSFWKSKGIEMRGFDLRDGSGVSVKNHLSAGQLAGLAAVIASDSSAGSFVNSLNLAGRTGDLTKLFVGTVAENKLRAKSGYMSGVRAYVGIVKNSKQEELAFGLIVNHYEGDSQEMKKAMLRLMVSIAASGE